MQVYLNLVTGRKCVVSDITQLPGNAYNRGLTSDYVEIPVLQTEYWRLVAQLVDCINCNDFSGRYRNTYRAIQYLQTQLKPSEKITSLYSKCYKDDYETA